jgi:hypothetical protein
MLASHGGRPDARARALLLEHLTPEQRREYEATGSFAVRKRGGVWAWCVWKNLLVQTALIPLVALTAFRVGGGAPAAIGVVLALSAALLPKWGRGLRVALSRRRTWRIDHAGSPSLEIRRKRIDFCVRLDATLPGADQMLAYKNILETNERYFLRKANARI